MTMAAVAGIDASLAASPTRVLHDDLLLGIFSAAQMDAAANGTELSMAFTIACVCSRWRSLALAYGKLWARVHIYVNEPPKDLLDVVHVVLSRIGTWPLTLHLHNDRFGSSDEIMADIKAVALPVSKLLSRASSIRVVELPIQDPTSYKWEISFEESIMSLLWVDTPHLRRFEVYGSTISKRYVPPPPNEPRLLPSAPVLDTVVLNGPDWKTWAHFCVSSLQLSEQEFLPDFNRLDAACPDLRELKVQLSDGTTHWDHRNTDAPTAYTAEMFKNLKVLDVDPGYIVTRIPCRTMRSLHSLTIHMKSWDFFARVPLGSVWLPSMPALRNLALTIANDEAVQFLSYVPGVTHLRISTSPRLAQFFSAWARYGALPALQSLAVDGAVPTGWTVVNPEDIGRNLAELLETRALSVQNGSRGHGISALRHLRLDRLSLDAEIIARLSDLVEVIDVQP